MTWRQGILACALLLAGGVRAEDDGAYRPSPDQQRVDRSFSDIPLRTPLDQLRSRLTEIPLDECQQLGECEWRDGGGVSYYLWADEPSAYFVVVKSLRADDFAGRPIRALGIGAARTRDEVLEAARSFRPGADFDCTTWGGEGGETCSATLDPGWVTISFSRSGRLLDLRIDAYHFT